MSSTTELRRYRALLDIARALGRVMEINALLDEILHRSQEVVGIEACTIFLPDRHTGELIIHSAMGDLAPKLFATRIPKKTGIAGEVFKTKKTIVSNDAQNDPRHYSKIDEKTGFVTRAAVTVPLLNNNECLGVLQALNPVGREKFDEKDEAICEAFSGLIVSALLRIEAQQRQMEKVKEKQELELASEIQHSFLPETCTVFDSCRIYMDYTPAKQIGGDFCFVYPCCFGKHRFLIGLGDVSGKGVPAALTMARATATIKAMVPSLKDNLGEWVTELNGQLMTDLHGGRFIGLTFVLVDGQTGLLHVCAAGQYPPFHFNGKKWGQVNAARQLPLGILRNFNYLSQNYPLQRGECWLLFSDGVTESRNSDGDEFTEENFLQSLRSEKNSAKMFSNAVQGWKNFVGDAPQHDDASILMLNWQGFPPSTQLEQTCNPATLDHARKFIEIWAKHAGFDDVTVGQIILACDEAVTNIYRHAYKEECGPITFRACIEEDSLFIQIEDRGTPVDPEQIQGRELEDLRPGGLGTVLLNKIFSSVQYIPYNNGTRLELRKRMKSET